MIDSPAQTAYLQKNLYVQYITQITRLFEEESAILQTYCLPTPPIMSSHVTPVLSKQKVIQHSTYLMVPSLHFSAQACKPTLRFNPQPWIMYLRYSRLLRRQSHLF